jgi:hypothetical protein
MTFKQILIKEGIVYGLTDAGEIFFATLGNKRLLSQWELLEFKAGGPKGIRTVNID